MDRVDEYLRRKRASKPLPTMDELDEPILRRVFSPISALFEGIGYVDAATRAGIANLIGMPEAARTGQETFLGTAPAGREMLGLGEGNKGEFESGDVPGFLVEALASPLNLVGVGALSKGGKAAARLGKATERVNALQKTGRAAADVPAYLKELEHLRELERIAPKAKYGKTLAEQARNKQRSLLSLDVPFTDINVPLSVAGGRISEAVLGGLGKGAGAVGTVARKGLEKIGIKDPGWFTRLEGRADPLRVTDPAKRAAHDSLLDVADERARIGLGEGSDELARITHRMKGVDKAVAKDTVEGIQKALAPLEAKAIAQNRTLAKLNKSLGKAKATGDDYKVMRIERMIGLKTTQLTKSLGLGKKGREVEGLMTIATEDFGRVGRLDTEIANVTSDAAKRAQVWTNFANTLPAGYGAQRMQARATASRIKNNAAAKVADLTIQREMSAATMAIIAKATPEIADEASRIAMVHSGKLAADIAEGAPVEALVDRYGLGYRRRVMTPEGLAVAKQLAKADPSSVFARFARVNPVEQGYMIERVPALEGFHPTQINAMFRAEALKHKIKFDGDLFNLDTGESVMRRLMESGRAMKNISYHTGVINQFMLPKASHLSDMSVAEYLTKIGVTKFGGADLGKDAAAALKGTQYENAFIPHDIAKQALEAERVTTSPEMVQTLTNMVGTYTGLMRGAVTVMFPAFHFRNAVSNTFMLWLAGVSPADIVKNSVEAGMMQRAARRAVLDPTNASAADKAAQKTLEKMRGYGALDATLAHEANELMGETTLEKAKTKLGKASIAGRRVGSTIENNAKIALFLDGVKKGLSESEAAERVKRYLFNYADLSRFEKDYLRRWAFFYTWQRKAIPLMFESLVDNQRKMRLAAMAGGQTREGEQQDLLSPYQASQHSIPFGSDEQGKRKFIQLGLPIDQLFAYEPDQKTGFNAVRTGMRKVLANLGPLPAGAINLGTGTSLRTGRPVGVMDSITDATPIARALTFAETITNPPEDQTALDGAMRLVGGLTQVRSDPQTAPLKRLLDKLDNKKAAVQQSHLNSLLPGNEERREEELKALRSLESRVRSRLSRVQ